MLLFHLLERRTGFVTRAIERVRGSGKALATVAMTGADGVRGE